MGCARWSRRSDAVPCAQAMRTERRGHVRHSFNSLKWGYVGDYVGQYHRGYSGNLLGYKVVQDGLDGAVSIGLPVSPSSIVLRMGADRMMANPLSLR